MEQKQEEYLELLKTAIGDFFYLTYIAKKKIETDKDAFINYYVKPNKSILYNKNIAEKYATIYDAIISIFELYEVEKNEVITHNAFITSILLRDKYIEYLKGNKKAYDEKEKRDNLKIINNGIKRQIAKFYAIQDILIFCFRALELQPLLKDEAVDRAQKEFGKGAVKTPGNLEDYLDAVDYESKINPIDFLFKDFDLSKESSFLSLQHIVKEIKGTFLYLDDYAFILEVTQNKFKNFRKEIINIDEFTDAILYNTGKTYSVEETLRKNIELSMQNNRVNIKTYFDRNKFYKVDDELLMIIAELRTDIYIKCFDKMNSSSKKARNDNEQQ